MVILDRRDRFDETGSDLDTVAAEAHRLYESEAFREDVVEALGPVFKQHLDCEAVDAAAEDVLREWTADDGLGALFQARNQIVTVQEADLAEGDIVRMESAADPEKTVVYVVTSAEPERTGVYAQRVGGRESRSSDLSAGFVKYCERFEVDRSQRDRRPHAIVQELTEEAEDV